MARVRAACATAREWAGVGPWAVELGLAVVVALAQVAAFARTDLSAARPLIMVGMQRYVAVRAAICALRLVAHVLAYVRLLGILLLALVLGAGAYVIGVQPGEPCCRQLCGRVLCVFAGDRRTLQLACVGPLK